MRPTIAAISFFVMAAVHPCRLPAQAPDTLTERDLQVAGLSAQPDTSVVRRVLGKPQHTWAAQEPNEDGVRLARWMYQGLVLSFDERGAFYTADVNAPGYPTTRGVRVGDALARVRQTYGQPAFEDSDHLLYARSNSEVETQGLAFFFDNGILRRIMIGTVVSVN